MATIALQSAATGLAALNTKLDVIANNLANVNTTGFKSSRANFEDLLYIERAQPGTENPSGARTPTGLLVGLGVKVSGTQLSTRQGDAVNTGQPLDLMIEGAGFFRVQVEEGLGGGIAYTRAGNLARNNEGELVLATSKGRRLEPPITIPDDVVGEISIGSDGRVFALQSGQTEPTEFGQITLTTFINPVGLKQVGENLFLESPASGPPLEGEPGTENRGTLVQGMLEGSNVDPTTELIEMIRTQRAFEMNSNVIRAADETLRAVAQLHR
ncbi:MAG: flagellar basal-body rod protein FlgG [Phycisphaerales bacterium]